MHFNEQVVLKLRANQCYENQIVLLKSKKGGGYVNLEYIKTLSSNLRMKEV